jgi:type VII secretion protein EccB
MWTQRDQLQAYKFLRRRLTSALQVGDAYHPASPSRRVIMGCALGVAVTLLIGAGFAVFGLLRPSANQAWRGTGQVVIERETGASFVLGTDGLLHPVLNFASARLLAGGDGRPAVSVAARSLAGVPRGQPLGIAGAPTSLPPAAALVRGPWSVCSAAAMNKPSAAGPTTVVIVAVPPAGAALRDNDLLVVRDGGGTRFVVTGGRRLRVSDPAALVAIGADGATPTVVSQAWLNALPAGPDVAPIAVGGTGRPGVRVGAVTTKVGQVFVARGVDGVDRYYAVEQDGLAPVTQTEAALILGNPADRAAYGRTPQAIQVAAADVATAPVSAVHRQTGYPASVPHLVPVAPDRVLCAATGATDAVEIRVNGDLPLPAGARPVPIGPGAAGPAADDAFVPPGGGALVQDQASGTMYLITDQGVRFPLGGADAAKALGYGGVRPVPLAASMLTLFPVGPLLNVGSARQVAPMR